MPCHGEVGLGLPHREGLSPWCLQEEVRPLEALQVAQPRFSRGLTDPGPAPTFLGENTPRVPPSSLMATPISASRASLGRGVGVSSSPKRPQDLPHPQLTKGLTRSQWGSGHTAQDSARQGPTWSVSELRCLLGGTDHLIGGRVRSEGPQ